jgi:hypothetical protein
MGDEGLTEIEQGNEEEEWDAHLWCMPDQAKWSKPKSRTDIEQGLTMSSMCSMSSITRPSEKHTRHASILQHTAVITRPTLYSSSPHPVVGYVGIVPPVPGLFAHDLFIREEAVNLQLSGDLSLVRVAPVWIHALMRRGKAGRGRRSGAP